ncbi:tetratricopeptide repeat protein [Candidatus Thorarchaeota archaeon]|nr:MAG: tetratricopeptide repeat protein [Candidatus Thorarchaeota archaeon]
MTKKRDDLLVRARETLGQGRVAEAEKLCREAIDCDKKHPESWHLLAITLMKQGLPLDSLDAWEQSLKLDDSDSVAWANYGAALSMLRKYDESEKALKKSLDVAPKERSQAGTWYNLGNLYKNQGRFKLAEDAYRHAIEYDPSHRMFWANLGAALSEQKLYDKANEAYKQAVSIDRSYVIGWQGLGQTFKHLGRFAEAAEAYQEYLRLAPQDGLMWNEYGLILTNLDRLDEELEAYQKATQYIPNDPWPWNNLGHIFTRKKEFAEAEIAFRKAIEIDSTVKSFWAGLHIVLMEQGNRGEEAQYAKLKSTEVVLRDDEGNLTTQDLPDTMIEDMTKSMAKMQLSLDQAYELLSLGRIDAAERLFRKIISNYPDTPELKLPFADIHIARGEFQEAMKIAEDAIKAAPKIGMAWTTRGRALAGLGKLKEAEESMKKAIEVEPSNRWLKVMYEEWLNTRK